ncbi:MAG: RepB family DNA primase, partial [Acidobacteriota bacterium]|nr:RepB family DNA primase [Acidobacteriota bacterium]
SEPNPTGTDDDGKSSVPPVSLADMPKSAKAAAASVSSKQLSAIVKNTEEKLKTLPFRADNSVRVVGSENESISEARKLVEAFTSVGVDQFKTVFISCVSLTGDYRCLNSEDVGASALRGRLADYVRRSERQQQSVCLRPMNPELKQDDKVCSQGALIQVDDCTPEILERLAPYSFLTVETSPSNFQAWIALPRGVTEGKRVAVRERLLRQLKETGANGGAFNSVRLAGSLNAKEKYRGADGRLPRVRLCDVAPGLVIAPDVLDAAGLLAAPLPPRVTRVETYSNAQIPTEEADYHSYLARSGKSDSDKPDRSNADICYAIRMLNLGWPRHSVASRLNDLSSKAQGRRDKYAENTVNAAARILSTETPSTSARSGRVSASI